MASPGDLHPQFRRVWLSVVGHRPMKYSNGSQVVARKDSKLAVTLLEKTFQLCLAGRSNKVAFIVGTEGEQQPGMEM